MKGQLWGGPHDGERLSLTRDHEVIQRPMKLPARDALGVTGPVGLPRPVPVARYRWDGAGRWVFIGFNS